MNPVVKITSKGAEYLKKGQSWMYANNLASDIDAYHNGSIVDIESEDGRYLGTGMLSKNSHITVRIMSYDRHEVFDSAFFENRIQQAWEFRKTVEGDNLDNCRIVFGEADFLPGLTVDRYNSVLVTQITSYGMEIRKDMIYQALLSVLGCDGQNVTAIYERNDVQSRLKEGLQLYKGFYGDTQADPVQIICENGLLLHVDIENGQKTGLSLIHI